MTTPTPSCLWLKSSLALLIWLNAFALLPCHSEPPSNQPSPWTGADARSLCTNALIPLVGTGGHGHAYPGATVPFGMVQVSPDTRTNTWDGCSGYHYSDSVILGFSHTHLSGTGCGSLGDVMLMPVSGSVTLDEAKEGKRISSGFSHQREQAMPGYYQVFLDDPGIRVELTATPRCAFHQYTIPDGTNCAIFLDLAHGIKNTPLAGELRIENRTTLSGSRVSKGWGGERTVYFVIEFSSPLASCEMSVDGHAVTGTPMKVQGKEVKALCRFEGATARVICAKVGISPTSIEGAHRNLAAEIPDWKFAAVKTEAMNRWATVFKTVDVTAVDPHVTSTFYANLYLSCLAPVLFNDVDKTYRGLDQQNHRNATFENYTTFSIWDIYRAEWPLLTLLQPGRINDMVSSLLAEYRELGAHSTAIWPLWGNETWCMIGYHCASLMTEAYLEGFRGFDGEAAYQAVRDTAMQSRNGLDDYQRAGYVFSAPKKQATAKTLEYSYDDWCIARLAEVLGHTNDAKIFYHRSANYRNLFDRTTGFFRGRNERGEWRTPFSPNTLVNDEYTEADAWQYLFDVQQDVTGMIGLFGGEAAFIRKLDALFEADSTFLPYIPDISGMIGQYSQGDEQSHHVAYLYNYAGQPAKTQARIRQIMATLYNDTSEGECGNVDCGQMAAWYVLSALGIYPVNPVSGVFAIGSPAVNQGTLHLDSGYYGGRTFTVIASNNSEVNVYVQSARLNEQPLDRAWLTRNEIIAGGTLKLTMGPLPSAWGAGLGHRSPKTLAASYSGQELPPPSTMTKIQ